MTSFNVCRVQSVDSFAKSHETLILLKFKNGEDFVFDSLLPELFVVP